MLCYLLFRMQSISITGEWEEVGDRDASILHINDDILQHGSTTSDSMVSIYKTYFSPFVRRSVAN